VASNWNCIARRLKEVRLTYGLSQKKLGILAGIDAHSASARMNQYELGKHVPNFSILQNIGKALGYPASFFTSNDDLMAHIIYLSGKLLDVDKRKIIDMGEKLGAHYKDIVKPDTSSLDKKDIHS
jgi:transcriptional regulator with XRE-family HTH domain